MPYMFNAAFHCDDCIRPILPSIKKPDYPPPWDTDDYPAYYDDAGDSDSVQHCDTCGVQLDCTLTDYGIKLVIDAIRESIEIAIAAGRTHTWDRIMPKKGTAEESHTALHGMRHVDILRGWAELISNYNLENDERNLVSLFLDLSRQPQNEPPRQNQQPSGHAQAETSSSIQPTVHPDSVLPHS